MYPMVVLLFAHKSINKIFLKKYHERLLDALDLQMKVCSIFIWLRDIRFMRICLLVIIALTFYNKNYLLFFFDSLNYRIIGNSSSEKSIIFVCSSVTSSKGNSFRIGCETISSIFKILLIADVLRN
jgi:hypothetical protein